MVPHEFRLKQCSTIHSGDVISLSNSRLSFACYKDIAGGEMVNLESRVANPDPAEPWSGDETNKKGGREADGHGKPGDQYAKKGPFNDPRQQAFRGCNGPNA